MRDGLQLKTRWRAGEPSPGMWLRLTDPTVVDMLGDIGLDWLMFDAEHVAYDFQTLQTLFIALKGTPTVPLVRVVANDAAVIKRVLDIGAAGVLVPHVNSAADMRAAVSACKYPPAGRRGTGPRRPGRYGRLEREAVSSGNDQTIVMAMIETADAARNIDEILAVQGLDAIILGPGDLASSLGHYADASQPDVQKALDVVIEKARTARIPFGDGRPSDQEPNWWLDRGAQIIGIGDDEMFIRHNAFAAYARFRDALERHGRTEKSRYGLTRTSDPAGV